MNHLTAVRARGGDGAYSCRGAGEPTHPCACARPRHCSHKSWSMSLALFRGGHAGTASGLGKSSHQCISWAASGADDTSPYCEQSNQLRVARASGHSLAKQDGLDARTIPLAVETIPPHRKFQGLSKRMLNHVFSWQHSAACLRDRDVYRFGRPRSRRAIERRPRGPGRVRPRI